MSSILSSLLYTPPCSGWIDQLFLFPNTENTGDPTAPVMSLYQEPFSDVALHPRYP